MELLAVGKPLGMVERDCVCTGKGLSGVEGIGDARAGLEGLQAGLGHLANDRDDDFTGLCTGCSARITAYCRRLGHARGFIGAGVDAKPRHHADDENDRHGAGLPRANAQTRARIIDGEELFLTGGLGKFAESFANLGCRHGAENKAVGAKAVGTAKAGCG